MGKVERVKAQLRTLWHAVLMPEILLPAAFIFLWQVARPCLSCSAFGRCSRASDCRHGPVSPLSTWHCRPHVTCSGVLDLAC